MKQTSLSKPDSPRRHHPGIESGTGRGICLPGCGVWLDAGRKQKFALAFKKFLLPAGGIRHNDFS